MSNEVTFLHAADLHLGAPFRGLRALSDTWADRLLTAMSESYKRVIDAALAHHVDFVVMPGDVFDLSRPSYVDFLNFFEGLNRLGEKNIPVYICTGNHDPYTSWQHDFMELPPNVRMFSADKPSFECFEKEGKPLALLAGRGYYNQSWPSNKDIAEGLTRENAEKALGVTAPFAIGVLHTGLNLDPTKAPTNPKTLLQAGMNYWALGHIHKRYIHPGDSPTLVFSGCMQGRDVNETGPRGVYKVTLKEHATNELEFIPCASVVWQQLSVDISACSSIVEVEEKITRELFLANSKSHCEEMCTRISLTGKTSLHKTLKTPGVLQDVRKSINDSYDSFFCDALLDKTSLPIDKQAMITEGLFPSVFLQTSSFAYEELNDMKAFLQDEFVKRNLQLSSSTEKNVEVLLREAEDMVLDLLGQAEH